MTTEQTEQNEIDYCYDKFIGTHIQATEPKSKDYTSAQGKQTYHEIPIQYNYGTPEAPIIDSCFIEFPIVTTNGGINCKRETNFLGFKSQIKVEHKISCVSAVVPDRQGQTGPWW